MNNTDIKISIKKKLLTSDGEMILNAHFGISNGEFVSLYGASGAGKTTIMRIIAGLTKADEGTIVVNGETWFDSSRGINIAPKDRGVGYMFQDYALFPTMTVKRNLEYAQHKTDKKHIEELLSLFNLHTLANRKPSTLSGGQQQRVALARALARKPKLLMLDEPLSAIDNELRHKLQDEILEIHQHFGITTLLVSHNLPEVFKMSSRVVQIEKGKITNTGKPYELFDQHQISGKVKLMAEIISIEQEDIVTILTLLTGNSVLKVAATDHEEYKIGDKVLVVSKAFNPLIIKI